MSLVRPVVSTGHGKQGVVSQTFDGTFSWEPAGYLRRVKPMRGRRRSFAGATYYPHIHLAIDYICIEGTPVRAGKSGVISWQGKDSTGAYVVYVRIRRTANWDVTQIFYHLKANSFRYKTGASVARGATVALSGDTGYSTGPHLHAELVRTPAKTPVTEIYRKGLRYDMQPFIDGSARLREIAP